MKREDLAYFNLIKFVSAVILAMFYHYNAHFITNLSTENNVLTNPFQDIPILGFWSQTGFVLVELFFIISGILFAYSYYGRISDKKNKYSFNQFMISRMKRLYPLTIVTTVAMYLLTWILFLYNGTYWSCGTLDFTEFMGDILFCGKALFNRGNTLNGPIWYINVLLFCYVIAYILTIVSKKTGGILVFSIPILLGFVMRYSVLSQKTGFFWSMDVSRGCISFFEGIFIGFLLMKLTEIEKNKYMLVRFLLVLLLVAYIVVSKKQSYGYAVNDFGDILGVYSFIVFPTIILIGFRSEILKRVCNTKIVERLGKISFGIYLWNFPVYLFGHILCVKGVTDVAPNSKYIWLFLNASLIIAAVASVLVENKIETTRRISNK